MTTMHNATEVEKRYHPPAHAGEKNRVDVPITVENPDDEDALELAAELREAVADAHREYREGGDDDGV